MFRLKKFEIIKHNFFDPQSFHFVNDEDFINNLYVTLLIGPNGSGKSQILSMIVDVFNILTNSQEYNITLSNLNFEFEMIYLFNSKEFKVVYSNKKWGFNRNSLVIDFNDIELPGKFLACAINLNDRYPFVSGRNKNSRYEYLGIKSTSNNAFINYNTLIERLSSSVLNQRNIDRFTKIFSEIGLKDEVTIKYKAGINYKINKDKCFSDPLLLEEYFENVLDKNINKRGGSMSIRDDKYKKILEDKSNLKLVTDFFNNNTLNKGKLKSSITFDSILNFRDKNSIIKFNKTSKALRIIRDLEILKVDKLILKRLNSKYSFEQASSGEHHILSGFINIISKIEESSLILIDEPEISLHPNWQIQYMSLLQSTFSDYPGCHFIISTHSHFLVSDLKPESSAIISFHTKESGEVYNETLEFDTNGWSAENILYRVFGVSTVRNHYLEMDLREILSMIDNRSTNYIKIREILNRLI